MTKTYKFEYSDGNYILSYTRPDIKDKPFRINAESMQFDTKQFYEYIFKDISEEIEIRINNELDSAQIEEAVYKKGLRVYKIITDLCNEITREINKRCFDKIV